MNNYIKQSQLYPAQIFYFALWLIYSTYFISDTKNDLNQKIPHTEFKY